MASCPIPRHAATEGAGGPETDLIGARGTRGPITGWGGRGVDFEVPCLRRLETCVRLEVGLVRHVSFLWGSELSLPLVFLFFFKRTALL